MQMGSGDGTPWISARVAHGGGLRTWSFFATSAIQPGVEAIYLLQGAPPSDLKAIHTFYGGAHKSAFPCEKRTARAINQPFEPSVYPNDARVSARWRKPDSASSVSALLV
jgi:hypothetical protein